MTQRRYWEQTTLEKQDGGTCTAVCLHIFAQRSCGRPILESVQGQAASGFEQPDLVRDVLAHGRNVGLHEL